MTFPRQERLRFKTFLFHTPAPKNNLGINKALDLAEQIHVINTKILPNVFVYVRLPVLTHEEGGVKTWLFRLSLNRDIISSPFPFSLCEMLCVSPLIQSIPCSTLLQPHWLVQLVTNRKEDLIELNLLELGRRKECCNYFLDTSAPQFHPLC